MKRIVFMSLISVLVLFFSGCPGTNRNMIFKIPDLSVDEGRTLQFDLVDYVSNYDVEVLTFEKISGVGSVVDNSFLYSPTFSDAGEKKCSIKAIGKAGYSEEATFRIFVKDVNRPPILTKIDGPETLINATVSVFSWIGEDPDDNAFVYMYRKDEEAWIDIGLDTSLVWDDYEGSQHMLEVKALDDKGAYSDVISWRFTYEPSNRIPVIVIPDQVVEEGKILTIDLLKYASDPDGDHLFFKLVEGVGSVVGENYQYAPDYDVMEAVFSTDLATESVVHNVTVEAGDENGGKSVCTFSIMVLDVNRPPVVSIPDQSVSAGETLIISLLDHTEDPDISDEYFYRVVYGKGYITGNYYRFLTGARDIGINEVSIEVEDSKGATDVCTFSVEVYSANEAPILTKVDGPSGTIHNRSAIFTWRGNDPDGEIVEYLVREDGTSWTSNKINDVYEWRDYSEGDHVLEVRARDNTGAYSMTIWWEFNYEEPSEFGAFKVANSWGIGSWENIPDGFLYITYEAMKKNRVYCFLTSPKDNYLPKAIAIFEIDHPVRDDCEIFVGVGEPSNPRDEKRFDDTSHRGGELPFPDNKMVLDITEFLPFSEEALYLKIVDKSKTSLTGTVNYFAIEIYDDYYSGTLASRYVSSDTPVNTINDLPVLARIAGISGSAASIRFLSQNDSNKGIPNEFLEEMKSDLGICEESRDYNQIVMGFGTGLMPPSNEQWTIIGNQCSLPGEFVDGASLPLAFDNSSSIYFPPIGDQGSEGSCVAFSQGYYTATFYEARDNGWNMTNAEWSGGAPTSSFLNKIMSPDFVYHLINDGVDKGSSYVDAQNVIGNIGISSWAKMPYDVSDSTSWPEEDAWREAPKYRNGNALSNLVIRVENDRDIQTLKSYIASGWLVSISIDANRYTSLSVNDVWNSTNYTVVSTNHANTIVGYDDNRPGE